LRCRQERWCQVNTEEIQLKADKHGKFLQDPDSFLPLLYWFFSPRESSVSPHQEKRWSLGLSTSTTSLLTSLACENEVLL